MDNVKTTRFSWGELESIITADVINGKRMYVGDFSRPNHLTWLITLNGASLSTDMAQRVVEIQLADPDYESNWEESVRAFIRDNRQKIIADAIGILRRTPKSIDRLTRWATWEGQVPTRMESTNECLNLITERRGVVDVEQEEGEVIEDYFAARLQSLDYNVNHDDVFIPNEFVAIWYNSATGDRRKTTGVTPTLKQMRQEHRIRNITPARAGPSGERGVRWVGEYARAGDTTYYDLRKRIAIKLENRESTSTERTV